MLSDFVTRAALAAIGTALACGPLGCFVVWRRMAYFGDATAHAAILGVALALAFSVSITAGVLLVALAMAFVLTWMTGRALAIDTALGVLSHGALALGLMAVSLLPNVRVDLEAFLFGDLFLVTRGDLAVIWLGAAAITALVVWRWQAWLTMTLSPELALAGGVDPRRESLLLSLGLAGVVAVALQVVGALLITAMLIIPAAAARALTRSPEAMALTSAALAVGAAVGGLWLSLSLDTPAGPSIVTTAIALFILAQGAARLR